MPGPVADARGDSLAQGLRRLHSLGPDCVDAQGVVGRGRGRRRRARSRGPVARVLRSGGLRLAGSLGIAGLPVVVVLIGHKYILIKMMFWTLPG